MRVKPENTHTFLVVPHMETIGQKWLTNETWKTDWKPVLTWVEFVKPCSHLRLGLLLEGCVQGLLIHQRLEMRSDRPHSRQKHKQKLASLPRHRIITQRNTRLSPQTVCWFEGLPGICWVFAQCWERQDGSVNTDDMSVAPCVDGPSKY